MSAPRKENKRSGQASAIRGFIWLMWAMQEREKAAEEEAAREHDIALGNPLLNPKSDFNVKRRYVVTRCQPRTSFTDGTSGGMTM